MSIVLSHLPLEIKRIPSERCCRLYTMRPIAFSVIVKAPTSAFSWRRHGACQLAAIAIDGARPGEVQKPKFLHLALFPFKMGRNG
jgi:hypothetical protein